MQISYRDLIWAAASHSLIREECSFPLISESKLQRLRQGDYQQAFDRFLQTRSGDGIRKVGVYFELLVEFLLVDVLQVEMVERNRQIFEDGRTVGEIDFIFRHAGQTIHLETAVKFYLALELPHSSGSRLVGPNSRDHFESKMDRLDRHQLPLSEKYFADVDLRTAFVRGRIFRPLKFSERETEFRRDNQWWPSELHSDHEQGLWCRAANVERALNRSGFDQFAVHRKPHWLADLCPQEEPDAFESSEVLLPKLRQHFQSSARPLMLTAWRISSLENRVERILVVEDAWPNA